MFFSCFLAFTGLGQYVLITFFRLVSFVSIGYMMYIGIRLSFQEEEIDDFIEEVEEEENNDFFEDDFSEDNVEENKTVLQKSENPPDKEEEKSEVSDEKPSCIEEKSEEPDKKFSDTEEMSEVSDENLSDAEENNEIPVELPSDKLEEKQDMTEKNVYFFGVDAIGELLNFISSKCSIFDLESLEFEKQDKFQFDFNDSVKQIFKALREHRCYTSKKVLKQISSIVWEENAFWNKKKVEAFLEKHFEIMADTKRNLKKVNKRYISGITDDYEIFLNSELIYQNYILCTMLLKEKPDTVVYLITNSPRLKKLANRNGIEVVALFLDEKDDELSKEIDYAGRVYLLDETAVQYLAEYFEKCQFKYWEILKEENIKKMSPMVVTIVKAMKAKLCYIPTSVLNSFIQGNENRVEETMLFPKKYHYMINRFVMIKKEEVEKICFVSNPTLLDYALYLKRSGKKKVTIFTQRKEIAEAFGKIDSEITVFQIE